MVPGDKPLVLVPELELVLVVEALGQVCDGEQVLEEALELVYDDAQELEPVCDELHEEPVLALEPVLVLELRSAAGLVLAVMAC